MHKVLPFVLHVDSDTRKLIEQIRLELLDLTGAFFTDDKLINFLCNTYFDYMLSE